MMACRTGAQNRLFYSFNLDEHIPQNHLLRGIERCLDLSELPSTWRTTTATPGVPQSIPN